MSQTLLIVLVLLLLCLLFLGLAVLLDIPIPGFSFTGGGDKAGVKSMMNVQRNVTKAQASSRAKGNIYEVVSDTKEKREVGAKLTLQKRLKYARWKLPPVLFRLSQIGLGLATWALVGRHFNLMIQAVSVFFGFIFMNWLLNSALDRRYKNFDADYAPFLLSVVGLLKTGMNPISGLEAAAQGLNQGSLVRSEVELMIERLRLGVSEDKSVGAFGEDIYHPEIELFVQALLLSRRVGGTLSDTLDRLARQVRRRQFFRLSANAAVGLQRGSIWFIIGILVGLEVYLFFLFPEAITDAWKHPTGQQVWQAGILLILAGIFWVRQVTKIRI
jgi:tight adherence protein B